MGWWHGKRLALALLAAGGVGMAVLTLVRRGEARAEGRRGSYRRRVRSLAAQIRSLSDEGMLCDAHPVLAVAASLLRSWRRDPAAAHMIAEALSFAAYRSAF